MIDLTKIVHTSEPVRFEGSSQKPRAEFHTHQSKTQEVCYRALRAANAPAAKTGKQLFSLIGRVQRVSTGAAGGGSVLPNKRNPVLRPAFGVASIILQVISTVFSPITGFFRALLTTRREQLSFIDNLQACDPKVINFENEAEHKPVRILNWNVGLMPEFVCELNDLRTSKERVKQINAYLNDETNFGDQAPDVICLQEVFDIDATEALCAGLKEKYPYIIHSVGPRALGMSSGLLFASKFPIKEAQFNKFKNGKAEDALANKGMLSAKLVLGKKGGKEVTTSIHTMHLQAKMDDPKSTNKVYADTRSEQLLAANALIKLQEQKNEAIDTECFVGAVSNGDLNVSLITDEINKKGQGINPMGDTPKELKPDSVYGELGKNSGFFKQWTDLFHLHHHVNGVRKGGEVLVQPDKKHPNTKELTGSWTKGVGKRGATTDYGGKNWIPQAMEGVRYDYCLLRPSTKELRYLATKGEAQILDPGRVIPGHRSGQSDHLPIFTEMFIGKEQ